MSLISFDPISFDTKDNSKERHETITIYSNEHIVQKEGQILANDEKFTSHVVIANDIRDPQGLEDAIRETVRKYFKGSEPVTEEGRKENIRKLRENDEKSVASSYSRDCPVCFTPNPSERAVLTSCGHLLCIACVLTIETNGRLTCPMCRTGSFFVKIHENKIELPVSSKESPIPHSASQGEQTTPLPITRTLRPRPVRVATDSRPSINRTANKAISKPAKGKGRKN